MKSISLPDWSPHVRAPETTTWYFIFGFVDFKYIGTSWVDAKRAANKKLRPPKPGQWVEEDGVITWSVQPQCRNMRRVGAYTLKQCKRAATRAGYCTEHANELGIKEEVHVG